MQAVLNPAVRRDEAYRGIFSASEYAACDAFYESRPSLAPTPLIELPKLAARAGVGALTIKDESQRFGLSSFKALGARYVMDRLENAISSSGVVCATAGNHGRAVARAARDLGVRCTVFVPEMPPDVTPEERAIRTSRIDGMRGDGAELVEVAGTYEEAVERAALYAAGSGALVVSDTGWPGYERIPHDIMAGYSRLFSEAANQWRAQPDVVIVQAGVGGLACAAASWLAFRYGSTRPFLIVAEPDDSACVLEAARAGRVVRTSAGPTSPPRTFMAGLRCAEVSHTAWPGIRDGVDAFVTIPDPFALTAMDDLDGTIAAGPSGACGVGALLAIASESVLRMVRDACLGPSTRVLAVVTEGK